MGLLDGVLGGVIGAGLNGVVNQFHQQGFGDTIKSWIGTGQNMPISPDQLHNALGADTMNQLAAKLGMSPQELATKLSTALPQAIDKLTPNGVVPPGH